VKIWVAGLELIEALRAWKPSLEPLGLEKRTPPGRVMIDGPPVASNEPRVAPFCVTRTVAPVIAVPLTSAFRTSSMVSDPTTT